MPISLRGDSQKFDQRVSQMYMTPINRPAAGELLSDGGLDYNITSMPELSPTARSIQT